MIIRKAKSADSKAIAEHMMLAMDDIVYQFIGKKSEDQAIRFLESLIIEKDNQYSYENCWVAEIDNEVVAVANIYDGAELALLRKPVEVKIKTMFNKNFNPEDETEPGEFYIDCVGVSPNQQGKGIGSKMFQFLIAEYVKKGNQTLGLLVDKENPSARRLYLKLGFEKIGEKVLAGKKMEHLQLK